MPGGASRRSWTDGRGAPVLYVFDGIIKPINPLSLNAVRKSSRNLYAIVSARLSPTSEATLNCGQFRKEFLGSN